MSSLSSTPRILIVRLSAIGDTIHTLPLASALKRVYPDCYLGWVVERPSALLVENHPLVDWVRVLPKGWLKSPVKLAALRRDLRRQKFDVAFDAQGLTKSAVAAWVSGAKRRIGFARGEARELSPFLGNCLIEAEGLHAVDKTLSLLRGIGLDVPGRGEFVLPGPTPSDVEALNGFFAGAGERYARGVALLGPWGSFASKLWPLERFGELAWRLYERDGMRSIMLGHGEEERERVEALAAESRGVLTLAPDVSVVGVAELARRARLFVGCDSFPMHAASAVGCLTVGLFGVTDPCRLGPYGVGGCAVYERLTLVRSTRERRRLGSENMRDLSVEKVYESCVELLEHGAGRAGYGF